MRQLDQIANDRLGEGHRAAGRFAGRDRRRERGDRRADQGGEEAGGREHRRRGCLGRVHGLVAGGRHLRDARLDRGQYRRDRRDPERRGAAQEAGDRVRDHHRGQVQGRRQSLRAAHARSSASCCSRTSTSSTTSSSISWPPGARCRAVRGREARQRLGVARHAGQGTGPGRPHRRNVRGRSTRPRRRGGIKGEPRIVEYPEYNPTELLQSLFGSAGAKLPIDSLRRSLPK